MIEEVDCPKHGLNMLTSVCQHIFDSVGTGSTAGFVYYPGGDDDGMTPAWCEACDQEQRANGTAWVDGLIREPDGLVKICVECYEDARQAAQKAGRLWVNCWDGINSSSGAKE